MSTIINANFLVFTKRSYQPLIVHRIVRFNNDQLTSNYVEGLEYSKYRQEWILVRYYAFEYFSKFIYTKKIDI